MSPVEEEAAHSPTAATKSSSPSSGKEEEEPVEEDDLYCIESTFVFFQVERRLFHVPTYRFTEESQFFAGMFKLPQSAVGDAEGSSRMNPIHIPKNIRHSDFRNFLKALYPRTVSVRLALSRDEWISVLRLSTFWYFLRYREMAISALGGGGFLEPLMLTHADKILYGREFKLHSWLVEAYSELVQRAEPICEEEALTIGYKTAFWLSKLRERRSGGAYKDSYNFPNKWPASLTNAVKEEFKDELSNILKDEEVYKVVEPTIKFEDVSNGPPNSSGFFGYQGEKAGTELFEPKTWKKGNGLFFTAASHTYFST